MLSNCTSGGCGSKIGPSELGGLLAGLPAVSSGALLVGYDSSDDAAVYQISPEQALVSTVDFFPPMVEDPCLFGKIAAANAMSDVYAMGGEVLMALNLVCFPQGMDKAVLGEMLRGGAEKVQEAGAALGGGHSIYDHEPKYGLAVTGLVHPKKLLRNNTPQTGDCLILAKPLGSGLVMAAARAGLAEPDHYEAATAAMQRLNRDAARQMAGYEVHSCTDVTGFGLAGHALEMAGEGHSLVIDTALLPLLPGALGYAEEFLATAAGQRNRNHAAGRVRLGGVAPATQEVLFDPQTSGGLLISVAAAHAEALCRAIREKDPEAAIIGQVVPREEAAVIFL